MADEDVSVEIPQGADSPLELLKGLGQVELEVRSYLGRGYQFSSAIDGVINFSRPDDSELSDRERVSAAFLDLQHEFGYPQCLDFAWVCEDINAALELLEERGLEDSAVAFWTSDIDDHSFGYPGYSRLLNQEFGQIIEDSNSEVAIQQWFEDNAERIASREKSERLQHGTLVCPLVIHYQGDPSPIVSCLTRHGLRATSSDIGSILVIPKGTDTSDGDYNANLREFFPGSGD